MDNPTLKILTSFFSVILLDQAVKHFVRQTYPQEVVLNHQGTWGILPAWISIVGLGFLILYVWNTYRYSLILWIIIAAGVSNLFDRVLYGGVIDYIRIGQFPVFNLADAVITTSILILLVHIFRGNHL